MFPFAHRVNAAIANDPDGTGEKVMVVNFRAHKYASASGAQLYADVNLDNDKAMLEYSVYFPPGFDFVHGGKLPGLNGGNKKWYVWSASSSIAGSS